MSPVPFRAPLFLLSAALLVGCSRSRGPLPPALPVALPDADDAARRDSIARAESARRDAIAGEEQRRAERETRLAAARATLEAPVYFAYDRADLSPDARDVLDAKMPILRTNPGLRLRLAGHTDERGSDQYNLALGQRRAASAMRYLAVQGIAEDRLQIVSFGEEHPVCGDSQEPCWSRNRRVEFEILAGDIAVGRPAAGRAN